MRDSINIGGTPAEEACAQVGTDRYRRVVKAECRAFINQLRRVCGNEPPGAQLRIMANPHDFGTYHEVVCDYDSELPESLDYALKVERKCPGEWDDTARQELMSAKVCCAAGCNHDGVWCVEYVEDRR